MASRKAKRVKSGNNTLTVFFFHGDAGNLGDQLHKALGGKQGLKEIGEGLAAALSVVQQQSSSK